MNSSRPLERAYAALLQLYPPGFKAAFGEEMRADFGDALEGAARRGRGTQARLLARELAGLVRGMAVEHGEACFQKWFGTGGIMENISSSIVGGKPERPTSWAGTLAGAFLFLLLGLQSMTGEIPREWLASPDPAWYFILQSAFRLAWFLVPMLGLAAGFILNFPRWSYPYVGNAFIVSLYMTNVATPGMKLFGYTFGPHTVWGWRAWVPLSLALLVGLAFTRSIDPLFRFFARARRDWTLMTFAFFGFMPLIVAIGFDEIDRLYSLVFMALLTLMMVATAVLYLRGATHYRRAAALAAGTVLVLLVTSASTTLYWLPQDGVYVPGMVAWVAVILFVMFLPALVARFRSRGRAQKE